MAKDRLQAVKSLLEETAQAHHQAFIDVDGNDPDWPVWYARYSREQLNRLMDSSLTTSELVYHFVTFDRRYQSTNPPTPWSSYYASGLLAAAEAGTI